VSPETKKLINLVLKVFADDRILIVIAGVALAAFFCIHNYVPSFGIVGNALRGDIWLTSECPADPNATAQSAYDASMACVVAVPYRLILAAGILLVAGHFIVRRAEKQ
jgi:hypothetical protein